MNTISMTEKIKEVGEAYIAALEKLKDGQTKDVYRIFDMFDCVHPNPGYQLGLFVMVSEDNTYPQIKRSWIHFYKGENNPIWRRLINLFNT